MSEENTSVIFCVCFSSSLLLTKFSSELQIHLEKQTCIFLKENHSSEKFTHLWLQWAFWQED